MIVTSHNSVSQMLPKRDPLGHKGTFGKVYCLCGNDTMFGAAILSAAAVLRTGAGLCIVGGTKEMCRSVITARPETIAHVTDGLSPEEIAYKINSCSAAVIGSGLGTQYHDLVRQLVPLITVPMVIDADGIRAMAKNFDWSFIKAPFVVTPHPGEMSDLCKISPRQINQDRVSCAVDTAKNIGGIVLLKGKDTVITDGEAVYINSTGNNGMATAGSGDVLGGVIGSLAAQGCDLLAAAAAGAYLHGLSGDIAAEKLTPYSVIASDLVDNLPEAMKNIMSK